jgi:nickel-dependent lactate racemase
MRTYPEHLLGKSKMLIERQSQDDFLSDTRADEAVAEFFAQNDYTGKRVLVIVPDNTRSGPVGQVFKAIYHSLDQKAKALDVLIALGTHQPMSARQICTRLSMTSKQRKTTYASVNFFNHEWQKPETFTSIGQISAAEIEQLSNGLFSEQVNVAINKLIFDYDEFFILGPVFPHEVVGFSGGHKYIFPGIAGTEIIDFFHWLGAVITNPRINGNIQTPTRRVVEKAASFINMPHKLFAIVALEDKLKGLFIGDCAEAWQRAAKLSAKVNIVHKAKPFKTVLGIAPKMYDDMWTAGKVMYKLEPVIVDGGTLIIYAPHINEISFTHGKFIDKIGYHTRDYFLKQMDKFTDVPRAVLAHSTHVKGIGTYIDGVERSRINVALATGIDRQRCRDVNLGYINPDQIDIPNYRNKEDKGILLVQNAGEQLYRLADGTIPTIPEI